MISNMIGEGIISDERFEKVKSAKRAMEWSAAKARANAREYGHKHPFMGATEVVISPIMIPLVVGIEFSKGEVTLSELVWRSVNAVAGFALGVKDRIVKGKAPRAPGSKV